MLAAGAKVLGGVHVGKSSTVVANAVVLCDVPAQYVVVGVPARVQPKAVQSMVSE